MLENNRFLLGESLMPKFPPAAAVIAAAALLSAPVLAQDGASPVAADAVAPTAPPPPECELHVWPTENYLGVNMGLLSGFGLVGALADQAAHKDRVQTVKDLMRDYLGPDVQMEELNRIGLLKTLQLPENYTIIIEAPTPFNEDVKKDPALKAKVKELNATIKAGKRLTNSQSKCYAELITTHIFYHKAMMYGSNLFTGWNYRNFGDKAVLKKPATGQVKNPLEYFPPKTLEDVDKAKVELRDAYSKDFVEYVDKKVFGAPAAAK
jgi:hypothetical protein